MLGSRFNHISAVASPMRITHSHALRASGLDPSGGMLGGERVGGGATGSRETVQCFGAVQQVREWGRSKLR